MQGAQRVLLPRQATAIESHSIVHLQYLPPIHVSASAPARYFNAREGRGWRGEEGEG